MPGRIFAIDYPDTPTTRTLEGSLISAFNQRLMILKINFSEIHTRGLFHGETFETSTRVKSDTRQSNLGFVRYK
jgi:hypothetical protein